MSYAAEVVADSTGEFCGNALRFATREEAETYARDLAGRWTLVTDYRVVESDDPVNEVIIGGVQARVEKLRWARVRKTWASRSRETVERYLPDNYRVFDEDDESYLVGGLDYAGWTLDGYVLPRFASGVIVAEEVEEPYVWSSGDA